MFSVFLISFLWNVLKEIQVFGGGPKVLYFNKWVLITSFISFLGRTKQNKTYKFEMVSDLYGLLNGYSLKNVYVYLKRKHIPYKKLNIYQVDLLY